MIKNMRDLGGIQTLDGMIVRHGCLIRSGNLHNAAPAELEGVSEIIDFRTNLEAEKMPDTIPPGIIYHRIPIFNESAAGITREGNISEVPDMEKLYRAMITEGEYRAQLRTILEMIFQHDYSKGAILWHCTAGKDRCGIVTALVLTALGADQDSIMADYLRSNDDCISESDEVYQRLVDMGMPIENADAVKNAYLAKPEYLLAALNTLEKMPFEFPETYQFAESVLTDTSF